MWCFHSSLQETVNTGYYFWLLCLELYNIFWHYFTVLFLPCNVMLCLLTSCSKSHIFMLKIPEMGPFDRWRPSGRYHPPPLCVCACLIFNCSLNWNKSHTFLIALTYHQFQWLRLYRLPKEIMMYIRVWYIVNAKYWLQDYHSRKERKFFFQMQLTNVQMTHSLPNERTFGKQTGRHIRIYCTTGKLSLDVGLICVCIWHKINTSTWNRISVYIHLWMPAIWILPSGGMFTQIKVHVESAPHFTKLHSSYSSLSLQI